MLTNPFVCYGISVYTLVSFGSSAMAQETVVMEDNFDSYADQTAFQTAWPVVTTTTGTLTNSRSVSASNSVGFGTAAQRNDRALPTATGFPAAFNVIRFSIDFFDSNAAASPYREVASLISGAGTSSGQLISLGLNNTLTSTADGGNYYMARILGADGGQGSGAFFKLNLGGPATLRSTGWHNLAVEISDTDYKFYVDNILAEDVLNTITARSYDSVRLGSGLTSLNDANFDNVRVVLNPVAVPEPSVFGLLGLGLIGLSARRRS